MSTSFRRHVICLVYLDEVSLEPQAVCLEDCFCQLPFVSAAVSTVRLQACLFAALVVVLI